MNEHICNTNEHISKLFTSTEMTVVDKASMD